MKVINFVKGLILVCALMFISTACSHDDMYELEHTVIIPEINETPNEVDTDTLVVSLSPQSLEWSVSPMSRSSKDDLYGVIVYQSNDSLVDNNKTENIYYAFSIFDDPSLITLKLAKNRYYHFEMVYVPNGKNVIEKYGDGWSTPFYLGWSNVQPTLNSVLYTRPVNSEGFVNAYPHLKGSSGDKRLNTLFRYMGSCVNYKPEANGEKVTIDLLRWQFGVRIKVSDFTKGTISLREDNGWTKDTPVILYPNESGTTTGEYYLDYPYYYNYFCLIENTSFDEYFNYKRGDWNGFFVIYYTTPEGDDIPLWTGRDSFVRMKMHSLEFSLSDAITNGGITTELSEDPTDPMDEVEWTL